MKGGLRQGWGCGGAHLLIHTLDPCLALLLCLAVEESEGPAYTCSSEQRGKGRRDAAVWVPTAGACHISNPAAVLAGSWGCACVQQEPKEHPRISHKALINEYSVPDYTDHIQWLPHGDQSSAWLPAL